MKKGPEAAEIYVDLFAIAIVLAREPDVRADAVDNFLLFVEKIIKDSNSHLDRFMPVVNIAFNIVKNFQDDYFMLFARSYYQIDRLAETLLGKISKAAVPDYEAVNEVLRRYYKKTFEYWTSEEDPLEWFEREAEIDGQAEGLEPLFFDISQGRIREWTEGLHEISEIKTVSRPKKALSELLQLPGYKSFRGHLSRHSQKASFRRGAERPGQAMEAAVPLSHHEHRRAVHDPRGIAQGHQSHLELADRKREAMEI